MGDEDAREPETQPAEEGVATASETEELGDGLVWDGRLRWTRARCCDVTVKDVKPG